MKRDYTKKIRAKLAEAIIVAIIGAVAVITASVINYAASTYKERHDDSKIEAGKTISMKFAKSRDTISQAFSLYPTSGVLTVSAMQKSGKLDKQNTYSFKYKPSREQDFNFIVAWSFINNEIYTEQRVAGKVKSGVKYDLLVSKTSGFEKKSHLEVDWLVK